MKALAACIFVLLLASGYGLSRAQTAAKNSEVIVRMTSDGGSFLFEPAEIKIKPGSTVRWVNDSNSRHTSTNDPALEKRPGESEMPKGAEAWSSPFLTNGESFSQTFKVPGKYRYFCRNHGQFGMEATIVVE